MASFKSRAISLLSGTRTEVEGLPVFATNYPLLVKDLTPRRIEGDYQAEDYVTGFEGAQGDRLYNLSAGLDFMIDAAPSGAAGDAPKYGDLLTACGLSEVVSAGSSVSYALQPQGEAFAEIVLQYRDAQSSQVIEKVRGALEFTAEAKRPAMFGFKFTGAHSDSQGPFAPAVDFSTWPQAQECTPQNMSVITLDGASLCVQSFSISDGRTPQRNRFMNCDDTENNARNVTGRIVVKLPPALEIDLLALAKNTTKSPFVWQMGSTPGNIIRIAAPAVQAKYAGEQDIDGEIGLTLDLVFTPDQGDDEFSITFS